MRFSTLVLAATLLACPAVAQVAGVWDSTLGVPGVPGNVFAVAQAPDGTVYVGGDFTTAGGVPALGVARWTGTAWEALGSGLFYQSRTAIAYVLEIGPDGALYVGGQFQTAGGVPANSVARWDGVAWTGLGGGLTGATGLSVPLVRGLDFSTTGDLFVAGSFLAAGGLPTRNVARWDGTVWSALGAGANQSMLAVLADVRGGVYFAGRHTQAGTVTSPGVARWTGADWEAVGTGVTIPALVGGVFALALDGQGRLYAGGSLTAAGGQPATNVARWDGTAWSAVGDGLSGGSALALRYDPTADLVYAGGRFTTSGTTALPRVAAWDGASWQPLGAGVAGGTSPVVYGFSASTADGSLFVSGAYTSAGGQPSVGIARWVRTATASDGEGLRESLTIAAWPNPASGSASVAFTLAETSAVRLEVLDRLGRSVAVLASETRAAGSHAVAFDTASLAAGVYVVRLRAGAATAATRVTVAR